jgi:hypothetical protein
MANPRITFAWASAINKVQVNFDQSMEQGSPGNPDDVETLANYAVKAAGGAADVSPAAVSLLVPDPGNSIVELTLDGEMTAGGAYQVEVSNVENQFDEVIDPDYDTYGFVGSGGAPQVVSAVQLTTTEVEVTFNEPMLNEPVLRQPTNYQFSGPTILSTEGVQIMSSTVVRLNVRPTAFTGGSYTLIVNNVRDAARNVIDPLNNTAVFSGVGPEPVILELLTAPTNTELRIAYEGAVVVSEATNPANYTVVGSVHGALAISGIVQIDDNTFLATTGTQYAGEDYDVTVTVGAVHDLYGNPITAEGNQSEFYGAGTGVPTVVFTPGATEDEQTDPYGPVDFDIEATGHPLRQPVRVNIADPSAGFTGIDMLSVWIAMQVDGIETTIYSAGSLVAPGVDIDVQTTTDDAGLVTEAVFRILPAVGHWDPAGGSLGFRALASDNEGTTNFGFTLFTLEDPPTFFEDTNPDATATDTAFLTPITGRGLEAAEKLRVVMLPRCTVSNDRVVQARTLLNAAAMTELRTLFAGRVDLTLVDEIRLADKRPLTEFAARMRPYSNIVRSAIGAIPDTSREIRELLEKYWRKSSPVYQMSAAATALLMTIFPES